MHHFSTDSIARIARAMRNRVTHGHEVSSSFVPTSDSLRLYVRWQPLGSGPWRLALGHTGLADVDLTCFGSAPRCSMV